MVEISTTGEIFPKESTMARIHGRKNVYHDDCVVWACRECGSSAISIEVDASIDTETMAATSWTAKPTSDALCTECGLEATVACFYIWNSMADTISEEGEST